ncbi:MAG: GNAT family N-acetyltransferase [Spirochaetales bacterium]|nr:GNAT family N-acetyltransferase [Spirochaetales bacterium]
MNNNIIYRKAVNDDIPEMVELLNILFSQEEEFIPQPEKQEHGLALILSEDFNGDIFIAVDQASGKPIGMVSLLYSVSTALGGIVATLEDMVLRSEYRANGIGSRLIEYASEIALKKDVLRITLLTDKNNFSAHAFYNKNGFSMSEMVVFRRIF